MAASHRPFSGAALLVAKMVLDGAHRIAEFSVGLPHLHAVNHKSHRRHVELLQRIGRSAKLRARGYARLDHDDGAIHKASQVLGLRGNCQGRGIGDDKALILQLLLPRPTAAARRASARRAEDWQSAPLRGAGASEPGGIHQHGRTAHGLQRIAHPGGQGARAGSWAVPVNMQLFSVPCLYANSMAAASRSTYSSATSSETSSKVRPLRHGRETQDCSTSERDIELLIHLVRRNRRHDPQQNGSKGHHRTHCAPRWI